MPAPPREAPSRPSQPKTALSDFPSLFRDNFSVYTLVHSALFSSIFFFTFRQDAHLSLSLWQRLSLSWVISIVLTLPVITPRFLSGNTKAVPAFSPTLPLVAGFSPRLVDARGRATPRERLRALRRRLNTGYIELPSSPLPCLDVDIRGRLARPLSFDCSFFAL